MDQMTFDAAELLMLSGVVSVCADCGDERIFVPTEDADTFCCTSCDAAVFLLAIAGVQGALHQRVA